MIVDTSALVAVAYAETGAMELLAALSTEPAIIITPVVVEFRRVTAIANNRPSPAADALLVALRRRGVQFVPFELAAADAAVAANARYGAGRGLAGPLNLLDLMVYGAARVSNAPILCTGKDFAATDALIHPASRVG